MQSSAKAAEQISVRRSSVPILNIPTNPTSDAGSKITERIAENLLYDEIYLTYKAPMQKHRSLIFLYRR